MMIMLKKELYMKRNILIIILSLFICCFIGIMYNSKVNNTDGVIKSFVVIDEEVSVITVHKKFVNIVIK